MTTEWSSKSKENFYTMFFLWFWILIWLLITIWCIDSKKQENFESKLKYQELIVKQCLDSEQKRKYDSSNDKIKHQIFKECENKKNQEKVDEIMNK